jgi:hypothetical protein
MLGKSHLGAAHGRWKGQPAAAAFTGKSLQSLTRQYCSKCHNTTDWAGGFHAAAGARYPGDGGCGTSTRLHHQMVRISAIQ